MLSCVKTGKSLASDTEFFGWNAIRFFNETMKKDGSIASEGIQNSHFVVAPNSQLKKFSADLLRVGHTKFVPESFEKIERPNNLRES